MHWNVDVTVLGKQVLSFFNVVARARCFSNQDRKLLGTAQTASHGVLRGRFWMLRYLQWASFATLAIGLWLSFLLHGVIEAGLAG